jgi:hypothetical protein
MRSLKVFDNMIPQDVKWLIYEMARKSLFYIGWPDLDRSGGYTEEYLHSVWDIEDLERSGLLKVEGVEEILKNNNLDTAKISKVIVNLGTMSDSHWTHIHSTSTILLYYVNLKWLDEWAGETLFLSPTNTNDVQFTSRYTPGRIVLFSGRVPHSIRPPSRIFEEKYRFTLTVVFDQVIDTIY